MFRRISTRPRPQSTTLAIEPLDRRLPMAGDMSFAFKYDTSAITSDSEAKQVEVVTVKESVVIAPSFGTVKTPNTEYAGEHVARIAAMEKVLEAARAMKEVEEAGLGLEVAKESNLIDPATGDARSVERGGVSAFDSGLPGWGHGDPLARGKPSSANDPVTGRPLLGGGDSGGAAGPSQGDVLAAGRSGKARAMDDSNVVTDKTPVAGALTFGEATVLGSADGGATWTTQDGTVRNVQAGKTDDGTEYVWLTDKRPDGSSGEVIYYKGGSVLGVPVDKPRPDDDSGTPPRQLTEQEKQQIMAELRGSFGPAGTPRDDYESAKPRGGVGEVLTYLDLAGQPRPDDEGHGGGAGPGGSVLTDLGLAGRPVGDDPNFGVITVGVGSVQPLNGGFGGGVQIPESLKRFPS